MDSTARCDPIAFFPNQKIRSPASRLCSVAMSEMAAELTLSPLNEQDSSRLRADAARINADYEDTIQGLLDEGWWVDENGEWHAPREERPRPLIPDDVAPNRLRARGTEPNPPNPEPLRGGHPGQNQAAQAAQVAPQNGWRQAGLWMG
eukprot:s3652_g8.t1